MSDDTRFLRALVEAAFPKRCRNCGVVYQTADDFLQQTRATGLKQSRDDDDLTIVEVYRNCACGSTLMDFFSNRRDVSAAGDQRRALFEEWLADLEQRGMRREEARVHTRKLLRGE
ncbi:MAG TPA: hypothetical protein VGF27_00960 [Pseudoduganella sp.]